MREQGKYTKPPTERDPWPRRIFWLLFFVAVWIAFAILATNLDHTVNH